MVTPSVICWENMAVLEQTVISSLKKCGYFYLTSTCMSRSWVCIYLQITSVCSNLQLGAKQQTWTLVQYYRKQGHRKLKAYFFGRVSIIGFESSMEQFVILSFRPRMITIAVKTQTFSAWSQPSPFSWTDRRLRRVAHSNE